MAKSKGKRKELSTDQKLDLLIGRLTAIEKANGIEYVEPVNQKILCLIGLNGSYNITDSYSSDSTTIYSHEESKFDESDDDNDFEAIYCLYAEDIKDAYQHYCHYIRQATLGQTALGNHVGTWMYRTKDGGVE